MIVRKIERRPSDRLGFTLMEVLVVVAILVVLAGTASVFYMRFIEDARKDRARTDVQTLTRACQAYQLRMGNFPASLNSLIQPEDGGKPFIESAEMINDPWNQPYRYDPSGPMNNQMKPDISTVAPDGAQIGNWTTRQ